MLQPNGVCVLSFLDSLWWSCYLLRGRGRTVHVEHGFFVFEAKYNYGPRKTV